MTVRRLTQIAVVLLVVSVSTACSNPLVSTSTPTAHAPTPFSTQTPPPTPVLPYPTPGSWERYFNSTDVYSIEHPATWWPSPEMAGAVSFDSPEVVPLGAVHARPQASVVIEYSTSPATVVAVCPSRPTTTVGGMPATVTVGQDTAGRPYLEWKFASTKVAFHVWFIIAVGAGKFSDYTSVYTAMLASITLMPAYQSPPCSPS